jgi:hypothetical protein
MLDLPETGWRYVYKLRVEGALELRGKGRGGRRAEHSGGSWPDLSLCAAAICPWTPDRVALRISRTAQ